jgi:2-dehydropantoate 2-reductase
MVSCLTRLTPAEWACDAKALESGYSIVRKMLTELVTVGRSIGYDESILPSSVVDDIIDQERARISSSEVSAEFITSTLLDVRAMKPFELEVILGEVIRIGTANGCTIPVSPEE